jgi:hypothetical protein
MSELSQSTFSFTNTLGHVRTFEAQGVPIDVALALLTRYTVDVSIDIFALDPLEIESPSLRFLLEVLSTDDGGDLLPLAVERCLKVVPFPDTGLRLHLSALPDTIFNYHDQTMLALIEPLTGMMVFYTLATLGSAYLTAGQVQDLTTWINFLAPGFPELLDLVVQDKILAFQDFLTEASYGRYGVTVNA